MKKQTAVEWFFDKMKSHFEHDGDLFETVCMTYAISKAMEKEQMEEAVSNGISKADMVDNRGYFNFDKWNNETYGGDHIGDVNEMVNHVPDVGKMVEDVEKLAEKYPYGGREGSKRLAFIDGYNTAKETLYTEEQVREAMNCTVLSAKAKERVIQSLKQSKQ